MVSGWPCSVPKHPALAALLLLTGCLGASPPMLPPQLQEQASSLRGFDEPPLWTAQAASGYRQRLRLVINPGLRKRLAIRIDTDNAGRTFGLVTRLDCARDSCQWEVAEHRRFAVPPDRMSALNQRIAASKLWAIYPEFWHAVRSVDAICVDGVDVVMERVDASGYRFSEANAQCSAPSFMLAIAEQMIDLAGPEDREAASWLH